MCRVFVSFLVCYAVLCILSKLLREREECFTSSSRCLRLVCSLLLWNLLVILTYFCSIFIHRHLKSAGYYVIPSVQKIALSVRASPSVFPSVRLSVRHHFVSALYFEHLLTDLLQTLHYSSYWGGVVWFCRWVNFVNSAQSYCPWLV